MIGEKFFGLTPRDVQTQRLISELKSIITTGAAVTLSAFYDVPFGRTLVLHNVWCSATPGGADAVRSLALMIQDKDNASNRIILATLEQGNNTSATSGQMVNSQAVAGSGEQGYNWTGEVYVTHQKRIHVLANFAAVGAACRLDLCGVLIPYGNFSV